MSLLDLLDMEPVVNLAVKQDKKLEEGSMVETKKYLNPAHGY